MTDDRVDSYRRRHRLVEEVPGLSIRRLTLEDPRSARESSNSRSTSPDRHTCHRKLGSTPSTRRSSSYRSWLERMREERPPFLTIVSLELPESTVPLVASRETAREADKSEEFDNDNGEIFREILREVNDVRKQTESTEKREKSAELKFAGNGKISMRKNLMTQRTKNLRIFEDRKKDLKGGHPSDECGEGDVGTVDEDCICSEIPGNLRINIRKKTELGKARNGATESPEVTHTIRIAMKYNGQRRCQLQDEEEPAGLDERDETGRNLPSGTLAAKSTVDSKKESCCSGVNVALDFTVNCSTVRLTSRDVSLRTGLRRADNSVG